MSFTPKIARAISLSAMRPFRSSLKSFPAARIAWPIPTRTQLRHFHPTRPSEMGVINGMLDGSYALIQGVHSVSHLPWVLSIPLTAVLVRTLVGFPCRSTPGGTLDESKI
ncbi:hypothetical protein N7468_010718 [Penicillium chermesinum]|uniref:Uncharacterized protein n=1 Tax=Penicillium chermesinum TaxID=63820 RepID=A0A9W9N859_9EURO|nr:uncharacterized protein N7468_010718 [Penicillium chermesinum]KAJ5215039.1 hypothetical protein N7468_010718 [Penicillium chermesinum]